VVVVLLILELGILQVMVAQVVLAGSAAVAAVAAVVELMKTVLGERSMEPVVLGVLVVVNTLERAKMASMANPEIPDGVVVALD
jgi:hypothetical protein